MIKKFQLRIRHYHLDYYCIEYSYDFTTKWEIIQEFISLKNDICEQSRYCPIIRKIDEIGEIGRRLLSTQGTGVGIMYKKQ